MIGQLKKRISELLFLGLLIVLASTDAMAESITKQSSVPSEYTNKVLNMIPDVNGTCKTSFLTKLDDGGYQSVVYDDKLYIENYDEQLDLSVSRTIDLELPIWGGFYWGKQYNYVVCGQKRDSTQENGGEVYRIIKYDKEFNRIASISLNSNETYTSIPFHCGNVSIAENEDALTVYTSRLRLDSHQSNIAIRINTENMSIINNYGMGCSPDVHTGHTFRQIVKYDGDKAVYVDLSDGYPIRSVYLQAGSIQTSLMDIAGDIGDNVTEAEVSGLEISDTDYMVVGQYIKCDTHNIFLSCANKSTGDVHGQWLTAFTSFCGGSAYYPKIVKINSDKYVVMWAAEKYGASNVDYLIIDGEGEVISGLKEIENATMSDCEPIYYDGKIIWSVYENGKMTIHEITDLEATGTYDLEFDIVEPENSWDGTIDTSWYSDNKNTFSISTPQQLAGLASLVNGGNTFEGKVIHLMDDIFLNDFSYKYEWTPIASCDDNQYFEGTFNGNKHSIYNMYTSGDSQSGGLFGNIGSKGIVKAVNISQGILYTGGCIAHQNEGIIAFCHNYSSVGTTRVDAGGICNSNSNLVYGCKNYGTVWGSCVGGIVGQNSGALAVISQCSNHGVVSGSGETSGIVHGNYGWLYNCYNVGILTDTFNGINTGRCIAGIAHLNSYKGLSNCYVAANMCYSDDLWMGVSPICRDDYYNKVSNCYVLDCVNYTNEKETCEEVSYLDIMSSSFIETIDQQKHSVFSAWMEDTYGINNGFPITYADYSYYTGECKIQPELWTSSSVYDKVVEVNMEEKEWMFSADVYYAESEPVVTIGDQSVATITKAEGSWWKVNLNKIGSTTISIHLDETENVCSADYTFTLVVTGRSIDDVSVTLDSDTYYYSGSAVIPQITINDGERKLVEGTDYMLNYSDNKSVGTATVTIVGKGGYIGTKKISYNIVPGRASSMTLSDTVYIYDATAKKPTVTVKDSAGNVIPSANYTVEYTDNINAGTATVKVTMQGNYTGTLTKKFTINKAENTIPSTSSTTNTENKITSTNSTTNTENKITSTNSYKKTVTVKTATVKVKVKLSNKKLKLSKTKVTVKKNKSRTVTATITKGTTDKLKVKAGKPSAVKVTVKGKKITIKGKKKGKLTITVTCGSKSKKLKVTVK